MVWTERGQASDCYFYAINNTDINQKNRRNIQYSDLPSIHRPAAYCEEIPVPAFIMLLGSDDEATSKNEGVYIEEEYKPKDGPQPFLQRKLNDLVRDLSLPKTFSEPFVFRLKKEKICLVRTCVSFCFVEDLRTTWDTSARRKTSRTTEMSSVLLIKSVLVNTIQEIGNSSLTATSAL